MFKPFSHKSNGAAAPANFLKEITVPVVRGFSAGAVIDFVRCALAFKSVVYVEFDGKRFEATCISDVALAGIVRGGQVTLQAKGEDAEQAVAALAGFITSPSTPPFPRQTSVVMD